MEFKAFNKTDTFIIGTGTPKGDPIEADALGKFFSSHAMHRSEEVVKIGSVKTNIGHLESAAGVAGIMKVLLMMKNETFVPSLHFEEANPAIDFSSYTLEVSTQTTRWTSEGRRIACVNSFGFGGTNSHAILIQFDKEANTANKLPSTNERLPFAVTAEDRESLRNTIQHVLKRLSSSEYDLQDVSYTSVIHRDFFKYRIMMFASTITDLQEKLEECQSLVSTVPPISLTSPHIAFVFCGVGTAYTGMCNQLLEGNIIFRETIKTLDRHLNPLTGWSIFDHFKNKKGYDDPFIAHIAIFACQVALTEVWKSLGVYPNVIVGQSVGEVAAAYVSEAVSLETAVQIIFHRSRILSEATGGTMAVVMNIHTEEVHRICQSIEDVAIAVKNSPMSCTISGSKKAIHELRMQVSHETKGKAIVKDLNVQCAYHSKFVDRESQAVANSLRGISGQRPKTRILSTVTAHEATGDDFVCSEYWKKNVRSPVLFHESIVKCIRANTTNIFVEVGPNPVLQAHLSNIPECNNLICLPSMKKSSQEHIFTSLSDIFQTGIDPNLRNCFENIHAAVDIPIYKPEKVRLLFESDVRKKKNQGITTQSDWHLFVHEDIVGSDLYQYKLNVNPETTPFIYEHVVSGTILIPGVVYVETALQIGRNILRRTQNSFEVDIKFLHPVSVPAEKPISLEAQVLLNGRDSINIHIRRGKELIAESNVAVMSKPPGTEFIDVQKLQSRCRMQKSKSDIYGTLKNFGFSYGIDIQILGDAWKNNRQCIVEMELSDRIMEDLHVTNLHPAVLDGLLQTCGILQDSDDRREFLPGGVKKFILKRHPERHMYAVAEELLKTDDEVHYDMYLLTKGGSVVAEMHDFFITCMPRSGMQVKTERNYEISWKHMAKSNDTSPVNKRKTTFVFQNDGVKEDITNNIEMKAFHCIPYTNENDLTEYRQELHSAFEISDRIAFLPCKMIESQEENAEEVFKTATTNMEFFLCLLQEIVKTKARIPILVVTFRTQSLGEECFAHGLNVYGSELWGMVRCIMKENELLESPLSIHLVDFHMRRKDIAITHCLDFLSKSTDVQNHPEIVVCRERIYTSDFVVKKQKTKEESFRQNVVDKHCFFELRVPQDCSDTKSIGVSLYQQDPRTVRTTAETDTIDIDYICLHHHSLYPNTAIINGQSVLPSASERADCTVLTLEVSGRTACIAKERQRSVTVVACYPIEARSLVSVPSPCIHPRNDLPFYYPGLLQSAALLYSVSDRIENMDSIAVICKKGCKEVSLTEHFLRSKVPNVRFCNPGDLTKIREKNIVILQDMHAYEPQEIVQCLRHTVSIFSLSNFLDRDTNRLILETFPDIRVSVVDVSECLSKKNLLRIMPSVFMALQDIGKNRFDHTEDDSTIFPVSSLPLNELKDSADHKVNVSGKQLFRRHATYIVVGGTSGLGWELSKFLARNNAGNIISMSRREPTEERREEMKLIERRHKCRFQSFQADVTRLSDVVRVIKAVENAFQHPIKGIFQGAGILKDTLFTTMAKEDILEVVKPKVLGSWNLHLASLKLRLDYFVMQSSITSVMGNTGQSNYGAGNAFMDSLAHYRRSLGKCGQSINWGPLEVGMAKDPNTVSMLAKSGYFALSTLEISYCLTDVLLHNSIQITLGRFDWNIIAKMLSTNAMASIRPKYRRLVADMGKLPRAGSSATEAHSIGLQSKLRAIPETDWMKTTIHLVLHTVATIFALDPAQIGKETALSVLNIDSMLAMTLSNDIEDNTNCKIPVVYLLSEEATIESVAEMILDKIEFSANQYQEESDSEPKTSTKDEAITGCLTPMEQDIYNAFLRNPKNPSLFVYVDLEVSMNLSDPDVWKSLLLALHKKHSPLRTLNKVTSQGVFKHILKAEETKIDFNVVPMEMLRHEARLPPNLESYRFDPERDLPLRTFFAFEEPECVIRFVFHRMAVDLTSVWILMRDIKDSDSLVTTVQADAIDVNTVYKERLHTMQGTLLGFWKQQLSSVPQNMSLSSTPSTLNAHCVQLTKVALDANKVTMLHTRLEEKGVLLFNFMVTMYQLLLLLELNTSTVVVKGVVDLRIHFKSMRNVVSRFTNRVPLFLTRPDGDLSMLQLLIENSKSIFSCIEMGILPVDQITGNVEGISPSDVFRHEIVMEETRQIKSLQLEDEYSVKIKRIGPGIHDDETVLYVWNNTATQSELELELAYSTLAISPSYARELLNRLIKFIDLFIDNPNMSIHSFLSTSQQRKSAEGECHHADIQLDIGGHSNDQEMITYNNKKDVIGKGTIFLFGELKAFLAILRFFS